MIKINVNASGMLAAIKEFQEQSLKRIEKTAKESLIEISRRIIERTPYDTGRLRGAWTVSRARPEASAIDFKPGKVFSRARGRRVPRGAGTFDPSGKDTIAKANAAIDSLSITEGHICWISNLVRYAEFVEYGPPYPRAMVGLSVVEWPRIVAAAWRKA
jgi:hypothetical protein